jgi:ubiquinone/menaquinone biosynthesis C-methylase UbiE
MTETPKRKNRGGKPQSRADRGGPQRRQPRGWDAVAAWYDGWVGKGGSEHHQKLAVPVTLRLLDVKRGESVLDVGAGQGVLAPSVAQAGASYTGVDVSPRLLDLARQHHGQHGRFIQADAANLDRTAELQAASFDAVVFLLSIQDIDPLEGALRSAAWALKPGGRVIMLMTHPCFRIPRQSGWGFDENRKLQYRRIDRYLTPLPVPMKSYPGQSSGVTISFHRPLNAYINGLSAVGLLVDQIEEVPSYKAGEQRKGTQTESEEIPLFLGLRAKKVIS